MIYITKKQVAEVACHEKYVDLFEKTFGQRVAVTPKNVEKAIDIFGSIASAISIFYEEVSPDWEMYLWDIMDDICPPRTINGVIILLYAEEAELRKKMGDKYDTRRA